VLVHLVDRIEALEREVARLRPFQLTRAWMSADLLWPGA